MAGGFGAGRSGGRVSARRPAVPQLAVRPTLRWSEVLMVVVPVLAVAAVLAQFSFVVAGLFYVLCYLAITFTRPVIALIMIFAAAPFVQDISIGGPFKFSMGELNLVLALPALVLSAAGRIRFPMFMWVGVLYLGSCTVSSILNFDTAASTPLLQMVIYLIFAVFVFGAFLKDISFFGMIIDGGVVVLALLALSALLTHFTFPEMHKNAWGATMSGGVVMAIEMWLSATTKKRKRWALVALGLTATCLLFSLSRGGWLAAITGTLVLIALRRQFKLMLRLFLFLIPLIGVLWFMLPQQEREYATGMSASRVNIKARYETIDDAYQTFAAHPIFGVGIGYRKEVDATNVIMVSLAESGVVGLFLFLMLHVAIFAAVMKMLRRIPLTSRFYSPVALAAALPFARLTHGLVDHYWSRGPLLQAWAAVGMAIATAAYLKAHPGVAKASVAQARSSAGKAGK
jgi:O-antigen ligase